MAVVRELGMMLRVYFLQQWFNLSDPGVEEALYDSVSMRRFAGIDLGAMRVPDESMVCRFRHIFGFVKTRHKGLAKNAHRLLVTCALANLYMLRRRLWRLSGV